MPRRVKSKHKAIERLAALFVPRVHVTKKGRIYRIEVTGSDMVTEKTKSSALAWLADLAKYAGIDPEEVGWRGSVPSRGLSAWEQAALEWLAR